MPHVQPHQAWTLFGKIVIVDQKHIFWVPIHDLMFYGFVRDRPVLHNMDGSSGIITAVLELEETWDDQAANIATTLPAPYTAPEGA
jgi:hypothetical protein